MIALIITALACIAVLFREAYRDHAHQRRRNASLALRRRCAAAKQTRDEALEVTGGGMRF